MIMKKKRLMLLADNKTYERNDSKVNPLKSIEKELNKLLWKFVKEEKITSPVYSMLKCIKGVTRDVAAAPQTPQLGGPRPTLGAQVSLKLLFGYVTIFSSADLFTTDLNCRKKLACDIISEYYVILSRRILTIRLM